MQDVFEEGPKADQPGESQTTEQPQGAEQGQQQPAQAAEQQPAGEAAASPAATEQGKHVPLEALEAERKGRQDWKEKAIRAEAERDQLRQQMERAQPGQPQQPQDPLQQTYQQIVNERFNTSEMLVRAQHTDVDEAVEAFKAAAAQNPALAAAMHQNPHPWKYAYEEGKRLKFANEIGNDPEAYRKKVRAEVEAEVRSASPQPAAPAAPVLPQSLAGARSAGARGTTFTGPTPMETIFPN